MWPVYLLSVLSLSQSPPEIVVTAADGIWRGTVEEVGGIEVTSFKNIRYGQAPVGERRFQRPLAAAPFNDHIEAATDYGNACRIAPLGALFRNDEDCLNLNVWTPGPARSEKKQKKAVMFYIYGGGFISGSADIYDGRVLSALGDVVVVTVNYRIGLFGFLFGDSPEEPGNVGIYDQILALKWVRRNIGSFGGDPDKVTIFGQSAGAWSTTALILSPLAKGLFRRAISQSGALNSEMVTRDRAWARDQLFEHAKSVGCSHVTADVTIETKENEIEVVGRTLGTQKVPGPQEPNLVKEMVECMKKVPSWKLGLLGMKPGAARLVWGTELLPWRPADAIAKAAFDADIDFMFGVTADEGSAFVASVLNVDGGWDFLPGVPAFTLDLVSAKHYIGLVLQFLDAPSLDADAISRIARHYTENLTDGAKDDLRKAVANALGDFALVCPTFLFGEAVGRQVATRGGHVYAYRLAHGDTLCRGWMGVCHGEDLPFVFGWPLADSSLSSYFFDDDDKALSRAMIRAWSDFAKTGRIGDVNGIKWEEAVDVDNDVIKHMELVPNSFRMVADHFKKNCQELMSPFLD